MKGLREFIQKSNIELHLIVLALKPHFKVSFWYQIKAFDILNNIHIGMDSLKAYISIYFLSLSHHLLLKVCGACMKDVIDPQEDDACQLSSPAVGEQTVVIL